MVAVFVAAAMKYNEFKFRLFFAKQYYFVDIM